MLKTNRLNKSKKLTPRQLRALAALLRGPLLRGDLDIVAGCSNGPQLVADLKRRGVGITCTIVPYEDRDGRITHPGQYALTEAGREMAEEILRETGQALPSL